MPLLIAFLLRSDSPGASSRPGSQVSTARGGSRAIAPDRKSQQMRPIPTGRRLRPLLRLRRRERLRPRKRRPSVCRPSTSKHYHLGPDVRLDALLARATRRLQARAQALEEGGHHVQRVAQLEPRKRRTPSSGSAAGTFYWTSTELSASNSTQWAGSGAETPLT